MGSKRTRNKDQGQMRYMLPIFIPTDDGVGELELGNAEVRGSTLVITFASNLPAEAIRARILRGELTGMTFVIPEEEAISAQEEEEAREFAQSLIDQGGTPVFENDVPVQEMTDEEIEAKAAEDAKLLDEELERLEKDG